MELTAAQTFEDWATGAVAIVTGLAIVVGGAWALWRYVLPGPLGVDWQDEVSDCKVRRLGPGKYLYTAEVGLTNTSNTVCVVERAAICILLPNEVPVGDQGPSAEVCKKELDRVEFDVDAGRCPPRRCKPLPGSLVEETLNDAVFVAWRIRYYRPRWLGIFGRSQAKLESERYVPVDTQSLALYRGSSK
jgi:hypothetical protein